VLDSASNIVHSQSSQRALDNLRQVVEILKIHGVSDQLTIDLGEIRGLHYHTGITFEGFVPHLGEPVCGGGRYDTLMSHYGVKVPATGFAFNLLALLRSLEKQPDVEASKSRDILLFNNKSDKRNVLEIAAILRRNGYSVVRDIIHHDCQASLAYAERMNILYVMIVGDELLQQDEISLIRVSDRYQETIKKPDILDKVYKITNPEK
jgi:ATP phosphoribosyltransferase regulatory subunit